MLIARFPLRLSRLALPVALCLAALTLTACPAPARLTIDNLRDGDTLRYPIALLAGSAGKGESVTVRNRDNRRPDGANEGPVVQGRFRLLVELSPGKNRLDISAGGEKTMLSVIYRPADTEHRVNIIYLTAEDGDTRYLAQNPKAKQDYRRQLDTMAKLLQTFTAEDLNRQGYGRKTFALDLDNNGRVKVHTLRFPMSREELQKKTGDELYAMIDPFIANRFPYGRNRNIVLMAFTGYDPVKKQPLAHTALGGGGLGLFSSNGMTAWPSSIRDVQRAFTDTTPVDDTALWDDSNGRSTLWGLASTTMGAVLHELGHTFGLPHPDGGNYIMHRGFDHINRMFVPEEAQGGRNVRALIRDEDIPTQHPDHARSLSTNPWYRADGLKAGWFLRRWRLSSGPIGWTAPPNAPALSPADVARIVSDLRQRPAKEQAVSASDRFFSCDLIRAYGQHDNVVAYGLAEVHSEKARPAVLLVGGDDGFRVWLNGTLVLDHPSVLASETDAFTAPVTLRAGANDLLIESEQAGGDWGFSVRLTDADGRPL